MIKLKLNDILLAVNSSTSIFKYPIGNIELTQALRELELQKLLAYDAINCKWIKVKK